MNLRRLTRTVLFRLAMLYALMFSLSVGIIFGITYVDVVTQVSAHLKNSVRDESASLLEQARLDNGGLTALIQSHLKLRNEQFNYALIDTTGHPLVGTWANPQPWREGWQVVRPPFARPDDVPENAVLSWGHKLPDGSLLIVGRSVKSLVEVREVILQAFGIGGGLILLFSIAGGLLMSAGFLRQIDRFNTTATRIMAGDLGERIPIRGTRDAFDQLAANLNLMLERVESFMEGMRQVTNDIAHDLRTPLTRLRQNLEGAARNATSVPQFQTAVAKALTETDDVLTTFSAMLRISQIEAGSGGMEPSLVDLSALCHEILEIYEPLARDKGTRLTGTIEDGVTLASNELLITQMLANLIENALNHTPVRTAITLELTHTATHVTLSVNDNGPGIPEADRDRVIKRFVRLERSRNTPGNGLGLALVNAVAARYGGQLMLTDNSPGLRATLTFPILA